MSTLQELLKQTDSYKEQIASMDALTKANQSSDQYFRIYFIYSSMALDGNTLTLSETKQLLEGGFTKDGRNIKDCYEVDGLKTAFDFMLEQARNPEMVITEEFIQKLHGLLYKKSTSHQNINYRTTNTSLFGTNFQAPSPEEIPRLMEHLSNQILSSGSTLHPIELAAMAHNRLIDIHPFDQGNGRTARLLMNLILVRSGYCVVSVPPSRKHDYIKFLSVVRRCHDMEPFCKLIAECTIESQLKYIHLQNQ